MTICHLLAIPYLCSCPSLSVIYSIAKAAPGTRVLSIAFCFTATLVPAASTFHIYVMYVSERGIYTERSPCINIRNFPSHENFPLYDIALNISEKGMLDITELCTTQITLYYTHDAV